MPGPRATGDLGCTPPGPSVARLPEEVDRLAVLREMRVTEVGGGRRGKFGCCGAEAESSDGLLVFCQMQIKVEAATSCD